MVGDTKQQFLLDSGASANFVSSKLLTQLEIDWDLVVSQSVRLADGKILNTCGSVQLKICFGKFTYFGTFYVLQETIPAILGMPFFVEAEPKINWKARAVRVLVGKRWLQLPCVQFASKSVHCVSKSRPGAPLLCDNAFTLLRDLDDIDEVDESFENVAAVQSANDKLVTPKLSPVCELAVNEV